MCCDCIASHFHPSPLPASNWWLLYFRCSSVLVGLGRAGCSSQAVLVTSLTLQVEHSADPDPVVFIRRAPPPPPLCDPVHNCLFKLKSHPPPPPPLQLQQPHRARVIASLQSFLSTRWMLMISEIWNNTTDNEPLDSWMLQLDARLKTLEIMSAFVRHRRLICWYWGNKANKQILTYCLYTLQIELFPNYISFQLLSKMAPSPGQDVCVRVFLDRWNMQEIRLFLTALVM